MINRLIFWCHSREGGNLCLIKFIEMKNEYFVYILASKKNGTLYLGVTSDIKRRVGEHKSGAIDGFTKKYYIKMLVDFEVHNNDDEAIMREKRLKKWNREWKIRLIEEMNPEWNDLYEDLF